MDFSRSVLLSCTYSIYPHSSSIERIQALALFSIYQWVSFNALREYQLLGPIFREERSEFMRKLVYHYPRNSDGANAYGTLASSGQALHAQNSPHQFP